MSRWKIGNEVWFKSGGPKMVVSATDIEHMAGYVECVWYSKKDDCYKSQNLREDLLVQEKPSEDLGLGDIGQGASGQGASGLG